MNNTSYEEKLEPWVFPVLTVGVELIKFAALREGGDMAMLPNLYEKYEEEGCPDWIHLYGSKVKSHKLFNLLAEACPEGLKEGFKKISVLKSLEDREKQSGILVDKYIEEFGESLQEGLRRKKITVLLTAYVIHHILLLPALFGKSLADLLNGAKNGNRDYILKLIQVDKSFIGTKWALKEIRRAQLSGDFKFLKDLAKNIRKDAWNNNKRKNLELGFVLSCGWEMGLKKLKLSELHDLVMDLGVYEYDDTDSLYREIKRLELRKREPKEKPAIKTTGKKMIKKAKRKKAT